MTQYFCIICNWLWPNNISNLIAPWQVLEPPEDSKKMGIKTGKHMEWVIHMYSKAPAQVIHFREANTLLEKMK